MTGTNPRTPRPQQREAEDSDELSLTELAHADADADPDTTARAEAEAKALSSVVRLRILRLCLDDSLTNKELADRLELNPATCLYHVRQLVQHGFLRADGERRGNRGAREVPYRATGKSWTTPMGPGRERILVQAFLDEYALARPEDTYLVRLGVRLTAEHKDEMMRELSEIFNRYASRDPDPGGEPWSLFFALHPDVARQERPGLPE